MRAAVRLLWLLVTTAAVASATTVSAQAAPPPPPADLEVDGGEESWHPSRSFRILWKNPATSPPVAAVHYRVRNPQGAVAIGPVRLPWVVATAQSIQVPPIPGAYTAEVWLEDAAGGLSGVTSAQLRFDDQRPGEVSPSAGATWIGKTAFPLSIRLSRPGRVPLSGIRGYAVSASPDPERLPCAAVDRCAEAEIDLHGGIDDGAYTVAGLPEGTTYVRSAVVSGSGMASPVSSPLELRVDKTYPTTTLHGASAGWTNEPVTLLATATDGDSGMTAKPGGVGPFTAISLDGATPTIAPGASIAATVFGEGVHRVAYYARDLAGNVSDGGTSNGLANPPPAVGLVRIDRTSPTLFFASAHEPSAPELIRARVADSLSGPDPAQGWIGVRRRRSGDPFAPLPAVPAPPGELRAHWDSEAYPDGEYEFRVVAFDLAGNQAATQDRLGGSAMVLSSPLKERTALTLQLAGMEPGAAIAFADQALLEGRLVAGSRALGSAPVEVVERFADGATRVSRVDTAADGSLSIRLAAGPSREVSASFSGSETLTRAQTAPLRIAVRGEVRMTTSTRVARVGGAPLLFAGRVGAAPGTIPAEGKAVELQFKLPGQPWSEFRTIRTDRRGRFRYRYRFSDDDSRGVRFLFRAFAPAQGGWPYEPAGSKPVAVRGR